MYQQNTKALRELNHNESLQEVNTCMQIFQDIHLKKIIAYNTSFSKKLHVHLHAIKYWLRIMILVGFSRRK